MLHASYPLPWGHRAYPAGLPFLVFWSFGFWVLTATLARVGLCSIQNSTTALDRRLYPTTDRLSPFDVGD